MKSQGFQQSGFEENVWIRKANDLLSHNIFMSVHIDNTLILCADIDTMTKSKQILLLHFDGTDEGEVVSYLGCQIVLDSVAKTLHIRQSAYICKVLEIHGMKDENPSRTPLEPGMCLSKVDCQAAVDLVIQAEYHSILRDISFLVQMTQLDLSFAFAELSKFAQDSGALVLCISRLRAARWPTSPVLLIRPDKESLTNKLHGWVDSDNASDPDNRCSPTGYLISTNNCPISWKAKRQSCTTLSSAEAEFVAASVCSQEVIYLRNLLRDLGYAQRKPTLIY